MMIDSDPSAPDPARAPSRASASRPPRLLIADDSADMRWLVRSILAPQFGQIEEAADGRQLVWHLIRSEVARGEAAAPLLVIADVYMPAYDGLEVLHAWQDGEPRVPLIVITSFPSDDVREAAARLGAILLAKPFTRAQLQHAVDAALRRPPPAP